MVSVDVKQLSFEEEEDPLRAQELCESRDGRPRLPPSTISLMVSVDLKHPEEDHPPRALELCQQGGGPGLSFPIPFFPRP